MTEDNIKRSLGVDERGYVKNKYSTLIGIYAGREKEGSNSYVYMEEPNGKLAAFGKPIQSTIDYDNLMEASQHINEAILYYFVIEPNKGLIAYMIFIEIDFEKTLVDFIYKYGLEPEPLIIHKCTLYGVYSECPVHYQKTVAGTMR